MTLMLRGDEENVIYVNHHFFVFNNHNQRLNK